MKNDLIIFILAVLLYFLNKFTIDFHSNENIQWFMSCYFNDIIGSIAFVAYCNFLLATQKRRIKKLQYIIFIMFFCGIVWEYITPFFRKETTTDIFDIVAYMFGGVIYWLINKKGLD